MSVLGDVHLGELQLESRMQEALDSVKGCWAAAGTTAARAMCVCSLPARAMCVCSLPRAQGSTQALDALVPRIALTCAGASAHCPHGTLCA
jgi:hypothetical protein